MLLGFSKVYFQDSISSTLRIASREFFVKYFICRKVIPIIFVFDLQKNKFQLVNNTNNLLSIIMSRCLSGSEDF